MKKFFLMFILTFTFLNAEKIPCLYVTSQTASFCTNKIYFNTSLNQYVYKSINPTLGFAFSAIKNPTIITGYSFDTITNTFEIDPIYNQINVSQFVSQPEILIDYINNPPFKNAPPPPEPEPEPEPEPNPNPNPNPPITITPDENGLIMGLTPQNFHFSFALWGVALSFLMAIGLILSF